MYRNEHLSYRTWQNLPLHATFYIIALVSAADHAQTPIENTWIEPINLERSEDNLGADDWEMEFAVAVARSPHRAGFATTVAARHLRHLHRQFSRTQTIRKVVRRMPITIGSEPIVALWKRGNGQLPRDSDRERIRIYQQFLYYEHQIFFRET